MKKIRYYYWILQTIFRKHFLIIIFSVIIGAFTFSQSSLIFKYLPRPKETFHIGRVGLYSLSNLPIDIQNQVSDGLTWIDESGKAQPALAKDWKIIDSGQTYIFFLKENLYWQDGQPFTSRDVNYSFQDVKVETPDLNTVIFRLAEPFAPFPGIVSQPLFKRTKTVYAQIITLNRIIGTGEYSITKIKRSGQNIQQLYLESPHRKLVYHFFNTEAAAITAFKLGEVDRLEDINQPQDLLSWQNLSITLQENKQRLAVIFFNTQDPENNLSNKSIRQALAYAVNKDFPGKTRAISPISPNSWAYNPKVKAYDYSPENARELLKDINSNFQLTLSTTPTFFDLATQIEKDWEALGIDVKIKVSNIPDTSNFQALLIGQQIPKDPDQYKLWHSTQETNITNYQSAKVDKLLEDGRKETDLQKRKLIYQDFQRFLLEDSPAIFLYFLSSYTIQR